MNKDPVCGMEVKEPLKIQMELGNKIYGFCSPGCLAKFKASPSSYLKKESLSTFLPLLAIFMGIIGFTVIRQILSRGFEVVSAMLDFMGAFFIVFAGFKLLDWKGFAEAYSTYDILAKRSRVYALAYPWIELGLGALFLVKWLTIPASWATLLIMSISAIEVGQAVFSGRKIQCACLGTRINLPMTKITLMEDVLMAVMAIGMIVLKHSVF